MAYRGDWLVGTAYQAGDQVSWQGGLWQAQRPTTGSDPQRQGGFWNQIPNVPYVGGLAGAQFAAAPVGPNYIPSQWYPLAEANNANGAIGAVDTLYFFPFRLLEPLTFTALIMRVAVAGTASAVKAGIWANSALSNRPLGVPLLSDNSGVATTSGPANVTLPGFVGTLGPGLYWFGSKHTGTLPQMQCVQAPALNNNNVGVKASDGIYPTLLLGLSIADAYANNIAATSIAEAAAFSTILTAITPNAVAAT